MPLSVWNEPLVFGDGGSLPSRIIPGPMEGVTEGSFVTLFSQMGLVDAWFTPFIRISNGVPRYARLRGRLEPFFSTGMPVIAQLLGVNTELLALAAKRLHEIGVVCVDLNCACPSPQVLSSGGGGKHLLKPQWIHDTLVAMKLACGTHPVSVKLRCGYSSVGEMGEIAAAVREAHPDLVTCHFRTVCEMYDPVEKGYERLARMHELLGSDITFFGSGDLFSVDDARRMYNIARVDGVAPARGLMKNPLLLKEIRAACNGDDFVVAMSQEEKLAFLDKIGELSGASRRHQVFLLKIAKTMFGEESKEFHKLLASIISPQNTQNTQN